MNAVHSVSPRDLPLPRALLLDFGGVVVQTTPRPGWVRELARDVELLLESEGVDDLSVADIEVDIRAAAAADSAWKAAMSRLRAPRELSVQEFWADFVAADWPDHYRRVVTEHAAQLCYRMGVLRSERAIRDGMDELLHAAHSLNLPVAIVSNALSGAVHRDFLAQVGQGDRFATQIYSDEAGVRKPNPKLILIACRELRLAAPDVWYVGDTPDRDVLCARRAGVGAAILMESDATYQVPYRIRQEPDVVVADPVALKELLRHTCSRRDVTR